jgi:type II secretory pathway pseudopilin PulG
MDQNRRPRFRVRLGTLLLVIAIFALLLMVVIQQVQIARQRTEIQQLRLQNDRYLLRQNQLQEIIRTQRDMLERNR